MPGWRRVRSVALIGALIVPVAAGCGGDDSPKAELGPKEWKASVYESVLRDIALPAAHRSMPDTEKPIVFLATSDGSGIGLEVQAIIARDLKDEADLRIEDDVTDVVLEDEDGKPVRDDGLLVTVTPLPDDDQPPRVELTVALYFDEVDERTVDVVMTRGSTAWSVTTSIPAG
jgi:hypothetical protein